MAFDDKDCENHKHNYNDKDGVIKKPKYPFSVFFIVSNEFCERFNYYGMRTILALYLTQKLMFSDDTATILYHSFTTLVYFCCIFGAIIADSWWGKFNTIVWLSFVYMTGSTILTIGDVEPLHLHEKIFAFVGLALISIGSGGIKPCVAAFGGEQFQVPEQIKQLTLFFSMFYFSINLGSFISTLVTPILRENVKCFGMDDCYPFGFGLPAVLMAVSVIVFLSGRFMYKILPVRGNMIVKIAKCIGNAIATRREQSSLYPRNHWLDYAEPKYGKKLVMETKVLLNVLILYIPLPIFWALFDQQGSRWTFQATRMNGDQGWFTIKPDQMQVVNPLLILTFIPLYEFLFYPFLSMIGIRRPLQKITLGGIFAGFAFLISMFVEMSIEPTYPILPKAGYSQFRLYNTRDCEYNAKMNISDIQKNFTLAPNEIYSDAWIPVKGNFESFNLTLNSENSNCNVEFIGILKSGFAESFVITGSNSDNFIDQFKDDPDKSRDGKPVVRFLTNFDSIYQIELRNEDGLQYNYSSNYSERSDVEVGVYDLLVNETKIMSNLALKHGGVYAFLIHQNSLNEFFANVSIITEPNSVNMLWLVPQYVIMTLAEVMFSVTGLQFSYTEAPESMKSVIQGCWLLTVAFGNIIVTIVVGAKFFESQVYEFLLFACLMFADMIVFMILGIRYKSIPFDEIKRADDDQDEDNILDSQFS